MRKIKAVEKRCGVETGKVVASLLFDMVALRCGMTYEAVAVTVDLDAFEEKVLKHILELVASPSMRKLTSEVVCKYPTLSAFHAKAAGMQAAEEVASAKAAESEAARVAAEKIEIPAHPQALGSHCC